MTTTNAWGFDDFPAVDETEIFEVLKPHLAGAEAGEEELFDLEVGIVGESAMNSFRLLESPSIVIPAAIRIRWSMEPTLGLGWVWSDQRHRRRRQTAASSKARFLRLGVERSVAALSRLRVSTAVSP
jgi:hypothetical protein